MKLTKVMMILLALALLAVIPALAQSEQLEACAVEPLVAGGGNYGTIVGRVLVDPSSGGGATIKFDTTAAPTTTLAPSGATSTFRATGTSPASTWTPPVW